MFVKSIFSDVAGFLARLSLLRRVVLLGFIVAALVGVVAWIWTQDATWAYITLFLTAIAWAVFGTSVAQISRSD